MPQILRETSTWNSDFQSPNHTYLLSDSGKIIAYAPWHGDEVVVLKSQMRIDKRYRTFAKTDHAGLAKLMTNQKQDSNVRRFNVKSKDKEYIVTLKENRYSCTCVGFTYRGKCKHSDAVAKKLQAA